MRIESNLLRNRNGVPAGMSGFYFFCVDLLQCWEGRAAMSLFLFYFHFAGAYWDDGAIWLWGDEAPRGNRK